MHLNGTRNKNNTFKKCYYLFPSPPLSPPLTFLILPESNRQENKTEDERKSTVNDYYW